MPLMVLGVGAVTPVGLSAPQTCAAIRAKLSGFEEIMLFAPPLDPIVSARVPARTHVKASPRQWLANMAARAIRECIDNRHVEPRTTALLLALPDAHRAHAAVAGGARGLFEAIEASLRVSFHRSSAVIEHGHAGVFSAIALARRLLEQRTVNHCLVGGVDSLVNPADAERLSAAGRLHDTDNPQGAIPGEGAAFWLLAANDARGSAIAQLAGVGIAQEADHALGERFAVGNGLRSALTAAINDAACEESQIDFRISDMNGERYHAWDSNLAAMRFYRTRREHFPVWYPAASTGDLGAAAGALNVVVAANAIARGFAPGPIAMCEGSSDDGLRAACVVVAAPGRPRPPFVAAES